MSDLNRLINQIDNFRDVRDWRKYHNAKDLSLSISLEAAELLECFQWVSSDQAIKEHLPEIEEELADILIYSLTLASTLKLDVVSIIEAKLVKNNEKYPIPLKKDTTE